MDLDTTVTFYIWFVESFEANLVVTLFDFEPGSYIRSLSITS